MRWRWLLLLLPAASGLLASLLIQQLLPNPTLAWRTQVSWVVGFTGVAGSLLALLLLGVGQLARQGARRESWQEAARDRRRFLQRLDHELKNPLTAIMAGLANAGAASGRDARPALESVGLQVQRLRRLVSDLRKLSDLETRELERAPVDLPELLREVFALARERPCAGRRQMKLVLPQAPWPLPVVYGDRDLLFLAIYNPLDNALKFTQAGDTIELRAFEADGAVVIEVADTGPGIPAAEIEHVWEELYRGEGARGVPGSGLGLALVRGIVSRHNGQAQIRSRRGQGTLVTLRLPSGEG